jgi:hypothetical protein
MALPRTRGNTHARRKLRSDHALDTRLDVDHRADASIDAVVIDMTKSAQIMELYAQGLSTREIAEKVGCKIEYVRVVARQRKGFGESENDRRYRRSPLGKDARSRSDDKYKPKRNMNLRVMRARGDKEAASKAAAEAYALAKALGCSRAEAGAKANTARSRVLRRTAKQHTHVHTQRLVREFEHVS